MKSGVRTRFAPSPTGYMHIGNLRTAVYEYLIARSMNGAFILRIEDTDQERYIPGSEDVIYNTLRLAGLRHDEGPDIGGSYGPYVQSMRKDIYKKYANQLIHAGKAYYCFCTKERLQEMKSNQEAAGREIRYDRCCIGIDRCEAERRISSGEQYVIRQKMPDIGSTSFNDCVYGTITVENSGLDDQILLKSDGMPTYNFANVVDDHLMEITHVVRGNEYLSSTPKYNLLYEAFGWEIPVYIHVPLILKPSGQKMSKRTGDPSFEDLIAMGYLVEAIVNYVVLLGWNPGSTREIFTLGELENVFNIKGISKSPAIFDINKLNWMNGEYIRKMTPDEFHKAALPYYADSITNSSIDPEKISTLLQVRTEVLSSIPGNIAFFNSLPEYDKSMYINSKMKTTEDISLASLKSALPVLEALSNWSNQTIHDALIGLAQNLGIKNGQMLWPLRTALTGLPVSPGGAIEIAEILGKEEALARIRKGLKLLEP